MKALLAHGQNMGDGIYVAQRVYFLASQGYSVDWISDKYYDKLLPFLRDDTDCPLTGFRFLETPASHERSVVKFLPYRSWGVAAWREKYPEYDLVDAASEFYEHRDRSDHMAQRAAKSDAVLTIRLSDYNHQHDGKYIAFCGESWNPARRYPHWDKISFPSGWSVVNLRANDVDPVPQIGDLVNVSSIRNTAEWLLGARLLLSTSTFTACLAGSLGIPVIALHHSMSSAWHYGGWPWGGIDPLLSDCNLTPQAISDMVEAATLRKEDRDWRIPFWQFAARYPVSASSLGRGLPARHLPAPKNLGRR